MVVGFGGIRFHVFISYYGAQKSWRLWLLAVVKCSFLLVFMMLGELEAMANGQAIKHSHLR